jgi:hypothetical protein
MRRTLAAAFAAVAIAFAACGGDEPAPVENPDPMVSIDENLVDIDSGRIQVSIRAITPGEEPVSFEMSGTFSQATDEESLPIADLKYSNRSGVKPQDSSFISDGERAWVVNSRGTKEVEGEPLAGLKGGDDVAGLSALHPKSWFEAEPTKQPGPAVDGKPTTTYSGEVDPVAVIEDIIAVSANLGAFVAETITDDGRDQIRAAAQNAVLEVTAGKTDDLLRGVKFGVDITGDLAALRPVLRELAANRIEFELSITDLNGPVEVPKTPEGAAV